MALTIRVVRVNLKEAKVTGKKEVKVKVVYAARFHQEDGGYWVEFPDLDGCVTEGDDLAEAIDMATEALGLFVSSLMDRGIPFAPPTPIEKLDPEDGFLTYISADPAPLRRNSKPVKKTLTIPSWLNKEAEKAGINFSKTLQRALELALTK